MIEGTFDRENKTLTYLDVTYQIKGMIDVEGLTIDEINAQANQIYNELGRNALLYTNKGLWDGKEDSAGLKDNIAAKTDLFLAWFGTVQPEYGKNNSVLPIGWSEFVLWNDKNGHYKLIKDGGEALATLLQYCEVYTGSGSQTPGTTDPQIPAGNLNLTCPKCGHTILDINIGS